MTCPQWHGTEIDGHERIKRPVNKFVVVGILQRRENWQSEKEGITMLPQLPVPFQTKGKTKCC
uniref:Uncharacterized protein n=1 Tax=Rhizophora mucronata TaxID=61149 RepID=A0A2P2PKC0_RHIMU